MCRKDGLEPRPRRPSSRTLAIGVVGPRLIATARFVVLLNRRVHGVAALLVRAAGVVLTLLALLATLTLLVLLFLPRLTRVLTLLTLLAALALLVLLAGVLFGILTLLVLLALRVLLFLLVLIARGIRCHEVLS